MTQMRKLHSSALTVISELEQSDVARVAGYSSLGALLSDLVRITPRRASRLIAQAGLVAEVLTPTGHVTPAALPLVRDALQDGALDSDHVDAIAETVKKIPAWAPGRHRGDRGEAPRRDRPDGALLGGPIPRRDVAGPYRSGR